MIKKKKVLHIWFHITIQYNTKCKIHVCFNFATAGHFQSINFCKFKSAYVEKSFGKALKFKKASNKHISVCDLFKNV